MVRFTAADKRDALIREANLRRVVYPRRIAAGKMREASAAREIAIMDAIAEDYRAAAEAEAAAQLAGEPTLF